MNAVIIPGYNEEKHIYKVVKSVLKRGYTAIVVDDGSSDKTSEEAQQAGATVLRHVINLGKGAAATTGCEYALKLGAKTITLMDADGQHKAEDIPRALEALKEKKFDVIIGYRRLNKNMPLMMRMGNYAIQKASNLINGIAVLDTQSGFRTMTTQAYKKIRWSSSDYGMESEMIANIAKKKLKFSQIEISTIYHDNFKGTTIFDGVKIMLRLLRWRLL